MALITEADFRSATVAEYCIDLQMDTSTAPATALTAAIARFTTRFQEYTNDTFEQETLTLSTQGDGGMTLRLPKRCSLVTQIRTLSSSGTYTTQPAARYRLHSSLYSSGSKRIGEVDYLELVAGAGGLSGIGYYWPSDPNCVEITGTFGWTTAPADVKRAIALMCWDHFKPQRGDLRRASRVSTQDVTTEYLPSDPAANVWTGISEVDDTIREYRRDTGVEVG